MSVIGNAGPRLPFFRSRRAKAMIIMIVVMSLVAVEAYNLRRRYVFDQEVMAFNELSGLATQMIEERGPGVQGEGPDARIGSYSEFFKFVALKQPSWASTADAPNPFPGLLHGRDYGRLRSGSEDRDSILFWSTATYHRPMGDVQLRLTCGGRARPEISPR